MKDSDLRARNLSDSTRVSPHFACGVPSPKSAYNTSLSPCRQISPLRLGHQAYEASIVFARNSFSFPFRHAFLTPLSSSLPRTESLSHHHLSPHHIFSLSICALGLSSPTHARDSILTSAVLAALLGKLSLLERMKNLSVPCHPIAASTPKEAIPITTPWNEAATLSSR